MLADVLEHVRNPVKLLTSSRRVLREAGCIIVSIPNVAHGAVRLALLRGRFEYQQLGILDDTHLRFYTRESVLRLLSESGFAAVRIERTTASVFERSDLVPLVRSEDYDAAVVAEVMRDEDAETLQFVVRAAPVAEGQVAAVLTAEITGLQQSVRMLRAQLAQAHDAAEAARAEAAPAHANGASAARDEAERRGRAEAERLAEVEGHYRNALELAEATRAERDEAVAAAQRAAAELEALRRDAAEREAAAAAGAEERVAWERERAASMERERELVAAAERAAAEAEALRAEVVRRDASIASSADAVAAHAAAAASSAAAAAELRANYDLAVAAIEPLRAELIRVQRLTDTFAAERDAALTRTEAAEAELGHASAAAAESRENLRATRALLADMERELREARAGAEALRAERDDAMLRADGFAHGGLSVDHTALERRVTDLASLLAVERTSREHVEESADRILAVARDHAARASASELRRLLATSAVVDMKLALAAATRRRAPLPPVPRAVTLPPALVLRAATSGRRTLTVLPPRAAGRRERLRAGWRRLRRLFSPML